MTSALTFPRAGLTEGTTLLQHPPPLGIDMESRNIFTLKEDFRISCYDMCSSLLSLKDIERQPQRTKKADHTSSGRKEVLIEEGMKFL